MQEKEITINPALMNIVNRIASGSKSVGAIEFDGGLLLQGEQHGKLTVKNGPLVVFDGAHVTGEIIVDGDIYVFGKVGDEGAVASLTQMTSTKTLNMASNSVAYGKLRFASLALYQGAKIHGSMDTIDANKAE